MLNRELRTTTAWKLTKYLKVSLLWWKYLAIYWSKYLAIRPFPDSCSSIQDIIEFERNHRVMGFNGQPIRAYIVWKLFRHFQCSSFIETGTFYGNTTGFVRRSFRTDVFSCEISTFNYFVSRVNLILANRVSIFRSSSPEFLRNVLQQSLIGSNPMFYLDAHWYEYMPLPDELRIIAKRCERGIIVIDDFYIPSDPRFGYDPNPNFRIDLDVIERELIAYRKDALVYLPAYNPTMEPRGGATGMGIILMGQLKELPVSEFPFNLLAPVKTI